MISLVIMFLYFVGGQDGFNNWHLSGLVLWGLTVMATMEWISYLVIGFWVDLHE